MRTRGPRPNDAKDFHPRRLPALTAATDDLAYLLERGYGPDAALQLVGNHHRLNKRQRQAVGRSTAAVTTVRKRTEKKLAEEQLAGRSIAIDGFNLLILLESALSGGYLLHCRDGVYRDLSAVHGTYKRIMHTEAAIMMVGKTLDDLGVPGVLWLLDSPVSNSGRLKTRLREMAEAAGWPWRVELVFNPDRDLIGMTDHVIISGDSWVIDHSDRWCNLGRYLVDQLAGVKLLRF